MQIVFRYRIRRERAHEFVAWLHENKDDFVAHPRDGWTYEGTYFVVQTLGDYDAESRWNLADYAALGSDFGDETAQRLLREFLTEWVDDRHPMRASLLKSQDEVSILATD